ncbi:MAG: DNA mismatch repair protein MutS, partial [Oscillospiraceae bacterium]|nr:DNA mismatch repair protein MutS [Oscillospiraceae bacterium]
MSTTDNLTPMMRQYFDIKKRNPDSILFFRLGDFYEMFGDDAKLAAKELDIVLTTRDKTGDPDERMPMCGVPYHSAETRIARLISKGYKVAICEQLEDPKDVKGIVDRDVVRVVTPGTLMESSMLDESKSNYLCAVYLGDTSLDGTGLNGMNSGAANPNVTNAHDMTANTGSAICFADLSTGDISVTEFPESDMSHIENELSTYAPAECIIGGNTEMAGHLIRYLKERHGCLVSYDEERFDEKCSELVRRHFGEELSSVISQEQKAELSQGQKPELSLCSVKAVGALLSYVSETQNTDISHLKTLRRNNDASYMEMDINTMRNLELVASLRTGERKGSLLWVLDKTKTSMGRRMIRLWILRPLLSTAPIKRRQSAVGELVNKAVNRGELILSLRKINDIERIIGKIVFGNAGCIDLKALSSSIKILPELVSQLTSMKSTALRECADMDILDEIAKRIDSVIKDDPPFSVREGKFIKDGVDSEVDRLRGLLEHSGAALTGIETRERERTGKKLKIGYNKVFGYYIEIPRSSSDDVPDDYIRKQTLANCERFITQELKELETELLSANEKITALEYRLFEELRTEIAATVGRVQETAKKVAELDVFCSLAETAALNNYCLPEIDISGIIDIKDGRHPVVEIMQQG